MKILLTNSSLGAQHPPRPYGRVFSQQVAVSIFSGLGGEMRERQATGFIRTVLGKQFSRERPSAIFERLSYTIIVSEKRFLS